MLFAWWPLLLLFLGIGKKKPSSEPAPSSPAPISPADLPTPPSSPAPSGPPALPVPPGPAAADKFAAAWKTRTTGLLPRAKSGVAWVGRMTALLGSGDAGAAASRWIGIESGGDPRNASSLNERGLAQVSKKSLAELGLTQADFDAMTSARTTDDQHAALAAKVIRGEIKLALKRAPLALLGWGPIAIGAGKLRHGLPLLLAELQDQGFIAPSLEATIELARGGDTGGGLRPSAKLASFAGGKFKVTGNIVDDLMLRFLGSAAVVAFGDEAVTIIEKRRSP